MKFLTFIMLMIAQTVSAQSLHLEQCPQRCFPRSVPPGNYSGIAYLGGNRYAVVSDKSENDGYFIFKIELDSVSGNIKNVENVGFNTVKSGNSDLEGVAYNGKEGKIYLCSEGKSEITEYDVNKKTKTGKVFDLKYLYPGMRPNGGIESLSYNSKTGLFWTINEVPLSKDYEENAAYKLRINSLDHNLNPLDTYAYRMDKAQSMGNSYIHVLGVSELTALDDGRLLVLEREFNVPRTKIGAYCLCCLYMVNPQTSRKIDNTVELLDNAPFMQKEKLCEWKTRLTLFGRGIANYEGMCIGQPLPDGRQVLILVSDSQNQYRHVLKDWFKSMVITPVNKEK